MASALMMWRVSSVSGQAIASQSARGSAVLRINEVGQQQRLRKCAAVQGHRTQPIIANIFDAVASSNSDADAAAKVRAILTPAARSDLNLSPANADEKLAGRVGSSAGS